MLAALLIGSAAMAASDWLVGLATGSSAQAKVSTVSDLTITAVASPTPTHLLAPDVDGDVIAKITNPNDYNVTITGVELPKATVYGTAYSTSSLATPQATCTATKSFTDWTYSTSTTASTHTLATPIVVAAHGTSKDPIYVKFSTDAYMGTTANTDCQGSYMKMPSLKGIVAHVANSTAPDTGTTSVPFVTSWTS